MWCENDLMIQQGQLSGSNLHNLLCRHHRFATILVVFEVPVRTLSVPVEQVGEAKEDRNSEGAEWSAAATLRSVRARERTRREARRSLLVPAGSVHRMPRRRRRLRAVR